MRLEGRIALVTGGSRGIGRGIALEMAREGADVAINYRRDEDAAKTTVGDVEALGRRAVAVRADVSDYETVSRMVDEVVEHLGRIDVLVANSGVASRPAPLAELPVEEWHRVTNTDLHGVFYTLRAGVPKLLEHKSGSVLIISSVGADACSAFGAPYHASKAGVNALGRVLAKELAPDIRVNVISPGWVLSEMGQRMGKALGEETMLTGVLMGRGGQPEEVGKLAVYLASDDAAWITGQIYRIDGGVSA